MPAAPQIEEDKKGAVEKKLGSPAVVALQQMRG